MGDVHRLVLQHGLEGARILKRMGERSWGVIYLAASMVVLLLLATVGVMRPWANGDTASWLASCSGLGCLAMPRFPLYRVVFLTLTLGGRSPWLLPWAQDALFLAAGFALARAARAAGSSRACALALALALPASNLLLIWGHAELPEILARAAVLGALAATVRTAFGPPRSGADVCAPAAAGLLVAVAYCLDPAQLTFIVVLPALALWLGAGETGLRVIGRRAAVLGAAALLPFLLIASLRLATLGDFNIVSFGGFEMSGIAARMLTPQTVPRLPADLRATADDLLARRAALVRAGTVPPIPRNSQGRRSLLSETIGYFDILARSYDAVLAGAVRPLQRPGESWVAFNARMQRLAVATVRARPAEYIVWVVAALARLVGRMLVLNLPFVTASLVAVCLALARARRRAQAMPRQDLRLLCGLTAAYTIGSGALACLVAFPAQRYIDGTGLLIAAWPIYAALHLARTHCACSRPRSHP
jgi:hypothetical protein